MKSKNQLELVIRNELNAIQQLYGLNIVLDRLIYQLEKDFARANSQFTGKLSVENRTNWAKELQQVLKTMTEADIQHLLYIIDVPEEILYHKVAKEERLDFVSQYILLRELQKVQFQLRFK
ncbi:MAG TPA: hypothetical protein PLI97_06075 [Fluviicola sp.]|nr:hypothetical protein [Fluviicola sp.]